MIFAMILLFIGLSTFDVVKCQPMEKFETMMETDESSPNLISPMTRDTRKCFYKFPRPCENCSGGLCYEPAGQKRLPVTCFDCFDFDCFTHSAEKGTLWITKLAGNSNIWCIV